MDAEQTNTEQKKEEQKAPASSTVELRKSITSNMDMFLDIPMCISTELGHTTMTVGEILNLSVGSVLELKKLVGEPMEIFVNGLMIARGEVVVVNEKFGVRVTDVVDEFEVRRISTE